MGRERAPPAPASARAASGPTSTRCLSTLCSGERGLAVKPHPSLISASFSGARPLLFDGDLDDPIGCSLPIFGMVPQIGRHNIDNLVENHFRWKAAHVSRGRHAFHKTDAIT